MILIRKEVFQCGMLKRIIVPSHSTCIMQRSSASPDILKGKVFQGSSILFRALLSVLLITSSIELPALGYLLTVCCGNEQTDNLCLGYPNSHSVSWHLVLFQICWKTKLNLTVFCKFMTWLVFTAANLRASQGWLRIPIFRYWWLLSELQIILILDI